MARVIKLTEKDLHRMVIEALGNIELDTSGACGLPSGVDDIILSGESDRECMKHYWAIVNALVKKHKRGEQLDYNRLVNSPVMKQLWREWFSYYKMITDGDGRNLSENPSSLTFRQYISQEMINKVENNEV
jgi:hypothetical protein